MQRPQRDKILWIITMNKPINDAEQAWQQCFTSLSESGDKSIHKMILKSRLLEIETKQKVLFPGSVCNDYLLMAEGSLRVQFVTKSGREVVLYHVTPGDDCVLTTSCLFGDDGFPAEGITETDVTVIAIPANVFHQTLQESVLLRKFAFSTFGKRLTDVISRIEVLCSSSIEYQLVKALLFLSKNDVNIKITHQELASEIGSVREVISRQLKKFENKQWIHLGRGNIEVLNEEGLRSVLV